MSNRSLRARSGPAKAFLLFFILICAFSSLTARAAGTYVAALPDLEIYREIEICQLSSNGPVYPVQRSACLAGRMEKRWMLLYNRAIDTLNKDVNLACDETHAIFDNTSDRISQEFDHLANGKPGENNSKPYLTTDHKNRLKTYTEREIVTRLTSGRSARDNSCSQTSSNTNNNNNNNGGNPNLSLTNNGNTSNPTNPPTNPPVTRPRMASFTTGESTQTTFNFSGPRVANSNLTGGSCSNRDVPACDNALMRCLRGCNSAP